MLRNFYFTYGLFECWAFLEKECNLNEKEVSKEIFQSHISTQGPKKDEIKKNNQLDNVFVSSFKQDQNVSPP